MSYTIIIDNEAVSFLEKQELKVQERITKKLASAVEKPHRFFKKLTEREEYKLRIGDYRVIADIDDNKKMISVRVIGHRKNIYDHP